MKIKSWPIPVLPPKLELPKSAALAPAAAPTGVTRIIPLARISATGIPGLSPTPVLSQTQALEAVRSVANIIAEQCGRTAKIVNGVIWLTIDGINFFDHREQVRSKVIEKSFQGTELLSSGLSLLGTITGGEGLEKVSSGVHFVAKFGDSLYRGELSMSPSELLEFSSAPDAASVAEMMKLNEILVPHE